VLIQHLSRGDYRRVLERGSPGHVEAVSSERHAAPADFMEPLS
jgi:hypothetical protein